MTLDDFVPTIALYEDRFVGTSSSVITNSTSESVFVITLTLLNPAKIY